jgi:hypothetical protein
MAYVERPSADALDSLVGYVVKISVDQAGNRDQLWFTLLSGTILASYVVFVIYLDIGTTAALAQFQILRDAMGTGRPVLVQYLYDEESSCNFAYWTKIYLDDDTYYSIET